MISLVSYVLLVIMVLMSIAFFTLMERSVLGYIHLRKGPNKVGIVGLFQPFSDVIKLFCSEVNFSYFMNFFMFIFVPFLSLILMLLFWLVFFWVYGQLSMEYAMVYLLCISSLGVYVIMWGGWASNSKYSLLGSFRGLAQVISYEVSLAMIMIGLVFFSGSYKITDICDFQKSYWLFWGFFSMMLVWLVSLLAETNRSPFDLSEGESELVSGFNVEYGSYGFAMLFMAEYGNIIFMSMITSVIFFGSLGWLCSFMMLYMYMFLLVRGTLVRYRYDSLMSLAWKSILPFSILMLMNLFMLKFLFFFLICIIFSNKEI
uniref:NADH dehydrogenase subunit 1 n=1 Tax=Argas ricei TaxID=2944766 RepID=UPI00223742AF|nr:NADH dehydrogenase subunit 1 [Argas ricei]UYB77988.1 NADH dehydrogenase subunit 1 [Argas sp. San Antonio ARK-2022a]UYB78001.1 NADH dehydrogenase subunit 1 [Argas ricei]